jgi:GAF domain-containing protein
LGKYLVDLGHIGSSFIEAMLAIVLALSLRQIHARVDHFVDSVFFRQRHLAERALRRLTHEVAFIDDEGVLAERTVAAIDHYGRATGCAIYLTGDDRAFVLRIATLDGEPECVDANDPAVVAMRAFHEAVDLDDQGVARSALAGVVCFPMVVRGDLIGLLDCGQNESLEAYDPDERETLQTLARAVGHTFDSIRTNALRTAVDRALAGEGTLDDLRAVRARLGVTG